MSILSLFICIIIGLICLVIADMVKVQLNKSRAELYCLYRIWKNGKSDNSTVFFKRELLLIEENKRKDTEDRYLWFARRWMALPRSEHQAFVEANRFVFEKADPE